MLKIKEGFNGERALVIPKMIIDYMEQDAFCRYLHITDIGYYPHARHHFRERVTPLSQYVFIYCVEGKGWYEINHSRHEISANQFFILPSGIPHSYGSDKNNPWTIYWMHFKGDMAGRYADGLDCTREILPSHNSRIQDRIGLFEEIFFTLKSGYAIENLRYANSILHHFLGSLRYISQFRLAKSHNADTAGYDTSKHAVKFMKENIGRRITLSEIAEYTGYTPNHFTTIFHKAIGYSPLAYFNLLKMQTAVQMLESTDMKINQIAAKLGYDDTSYFTRLFTKIIGISPKKYRISDKG